MPLPEAEPTKPEWTGQRIGCDYSPAFVEAFCELIADGATLRSLALRQDMPSRPTIAKWMRDHAEFRRAYSVAWQSRADARVDRMDEIVEKVAEGKLEPDAARVFIAHYRWAASKEQPNRYGDKIAVIPILPPAPAGPITLDPHDPKAALRIVQSVFDSLS